MSEAKPVKFMIDKARQYERLAEDYRRRAVILRGDPAASELLTRAHEAEELAVNFGDLARAHKGLDPETDREEWDRRSAEAARLLGLLPGEGEGK